MVFFFFFLQWICGLEVRLLINAVGFWLNGVGGGVIVIVFFLISC